MSNNWDYGGYYNDYDMSGIIELGDKTQEPSLLQVQDITKGFPSFLMQADAIICDPPCSQGNISSFYTKADLQGYGNFDDFTEALFALIDTIKPEFVALELFKSNYEIYMKNLHKRFKYVTSVGSKYYNKPDNICFFSFASNKSSDITRAANRFSNKGLDESLIIRELCKTLPYKCICDPCMGRGLVGINCFKYKKRFVGTELNKKRLAVLIHKIEELEKKQNAK